MKKVTIIGGGVIGLCSAYYLVKEGHKVSVIDQSSMDSGASYVNAGYLTPSHIIPLAAPGAVKQGIRWMLNSASPLYVKPRLNASFLDWAWALKKSCTDENVDRSVKVIKNINLFSAELFSQIREDENFKFQLENKGLLMICQSEAMLKEEIHLAKRASEEGLDVRELSLDELKNMEPNVSINSLGAIHYKCDWHTTPHEFMKEMQIWLENNGVSFYKNEKVEDIRVSVGKIRSIHTQKNTFTADEFVLAAGSWSNLLSRKLGINIRLEAGKGYRINKEDHTGISIPAILAESKIAVTPMNGFTRFSGTMEIAGINHNINMARVETIAKVVTNYYPEITITEKEKKEASCGLRPVSPDGKPYIGKSAKCGNLTIASGHAMMGWSLGPATGKLVSEIISEKKTSLQLDPFHPDRRF